MGACHHTGALVTDPRTGDRHCGDCDARIYAARATGRYPRGTAMRDNPGTTVRTTPALLWLTGREDLLATAWREFTGALGARREVSMTCYEYPARQLSLAGYRVIRIQLDDPCYVRETVADPEDGRWTDHTGQECTTTEVVRTALALITKP
ncbi:hypothetical protein [Streptomyces sp. YIM 98790]|uniref:hypothetical protein n=1 Tax=Streptomyces sp. YIM 98790 TaxID=2689077 RepID=UPI00140CFA6B|nr:hypothetical protein [Streptomyces sp. YIM 98790]